MASGVLVTGLTSVPSDRLGSPSRAVQGRDQRRLNKADATDAARLAIGAADFHPLSVRRFALAAATIEGDNYPDTGGLAGKQACRLAAADPQRRWAALRKRLMPA